MDRGAWEATVHGVAKSQTQHTRTRKQQHGGVVGERGQASQRRGFRESPGRSFILSEE